MRRLAILVLAELTAVILVGCGGSRHNGITRPHALAFARTVNLHASDLREWKLIRAELQVSRPAQANINYAACDGGVNPHRAVVQTFSPTFASRDRGVTYRVTSAITVMPTAALTEQDEEARTSARGYACGVREMKQEGRVLVRLHRIAQRSSYAFRTVVRHDRYVADTIGFALGAAEIALIAEGEPRAVPPATERHLLSLLYSRAEAHGL